MSEKKELLQYFDEHVSVRDFKGSYFFPDTGCVLTKDYLQHQKRIKDLQVFEDDVWVLSYPKCGTTWCQEMVWLVANNLDYKGAETSLDTRYSFLEIGALIGETEADGKTLLMDTIKQAQDMPRPRFIKSHLPLALLPTQLFEKKSKVILILRDPRDTAVSYLHHCRLLMGYFGTAEKFYEAFLEGDVPYGSYWHYLAPLWRLRQESNMMVTTYEAMKKDLPDVIRRVAKFLGKGAVNDDDVPGLLDHLSFTKMKTNDATNYKGFVGTVTNLLDNVVVPDGEFMRKGVVGDYKNAMSEEMVKKFVLHNAEMKRKLVLADNKDFPY